MLKSTTLESYTHTGDLDNPPAQTSFTLVDFDFLSKRTEFQKELNKK